MLCKMTSKNQLTLPKEVLKNCPEHTYFEARWESGKIILEPVLIRPLENQELSSIRDRIASLGITENDIADIVAEARSP